jgi:HEAT repeat protein
LQVGFLFVQGIRPQCMPLMMAGGTGQATMGDYTAFLRKLDDALVHYRTVERERIQALTRMEALELEVKVLRTLTPLTCAGNNTGIVQYHRSATGALMADTDGLYNHGFRDRALKVLSRILAEDSDPQLRRWATLALGLMGDLKSVPALASAMNDTDKAVRREAASALGRIGTAHVVVPLAAALRDQDKRVRDRAVAALGRAGRPAIRPLICGLSDPDVLVRRASSAALVRIGQQAISPLTTAMSQDGHKAERIGAIETLGRIGDGRTVPSMVVALMDPDSDIRDAAAQALVRTGQPAVAPLVRVLRIAGNPLRQRVAEVLARTRSLAVDPLIDALRDENADVRLTASQALVEIGGAALRLLSRALKNSSPAIRLEAATVLGLTGDPRAVVPLVQAMEGKDRELRQRATESMVRLGAPAAAPLVSLLKAADAGLRREASRALVQIGRPAFEPLCRALLDADLSTRWEAAQVLNSLRSSGRLRGLHGKWERTTDDTLLLVWFKSGWARDSARAAALHPDSKHPSTTSLLARWLPTHWKRNLGRSSGSP